MVTASAPVDASPSSPKRRRRLILAAVATVTAAAIGGGLLLRGGGDGSGLVPTDPDLTYGMPLEPQDNATFTLAMIYLRHPGREVKILEVEPLTSPNIEYLGAFTVWPRDFSNNKLSIGPGFPPPELKVRHELGETVSAAETAFISTVSNKNVPLAVAVGFRLASGDLGAVNGIMVTYSLDGKRTSEIIRQAAIVCTGAPRCERPPEGVSEAENADKILRQFGLLPKK
jgi:hypothetical protein